MNDGYDYRNWQLHSGAAGVNGLSDEVLKALSSNALHVVHTIAIGAVDLVATEFHIRGTIDDFTSRLQELRLIPGFVMTDIRLRSLGEPQRMFITHLRDQSQHPRRRPRREGHDGEGKGQTLRVPNTHQFRTIRVAWYFLRFVGKSQQSVSVSPTTRPALTAPNSSPDFSASARSSPEWPLGAQTFPSEASKRSHRRFVWWANSNASNISNWSKAAS